MVKRVVILVVCFAILASTIPRSAFGFSDPNIGTQVPPSGTFACTGPWTKVICAIRRVTDFMRTIRKLTKVLGYIPHQFPFGGPILSSERACSFKFDEYTFAFTICIPFAGCWTPALGPVPITIPLGGRAIVVGPPVPTYPKSTNPNDPVPPPGGKVIAFPWISKIYRNHTENRAGPWALGLGFSPFPLKNINDALGGIKVRIPPNYLDPLDSPCWVPVAGFYIGVCLDDFHFDCAESGEKDQFGNDIYKVIRLLGTSPNNAPARAFPPGFPVP